MGGHIGTRQMTDRGKYCYKQLNYRETTHKHDSCLSMQDAAQHVTGAGSRHAHARSQEGGEQHVRPPHSHDWTRGYRPPVLWNDPAVNDRMTERHLHPAVVGEDPERGKHRPE